MVSSTFAVISALVAVALAAPARRAPPIGNIATSNNPNLCVVPQGNADGNGTPVQLAACSNVPWTFNGGSFSLSDGQCLDVVDGVDADGTRVQTWQCTGGPNQQFEQDGQLIRWVGHNKCLDVTNGVFAPGTPLQIWDCTSGPNQLFNFPASPQIPPPQSLTTFQSTAHPELCMDVAGGIDADGTALQIFTCNGTPAQSFFPASGGWHVFENKAIDLTNGDQTDGNKLQIFTSFPGNTNQQWNYDSVNKAFRLAINPNKCIDITDGVFADGTRLQVWDCTFGVNQQFSAVSA